MYWLYQDSKGVLYCVNFYAETTGCLIFDLDNTELS